MEVGQVGVVFEQTGSRKERHPVPACLGMEGDVPACLPSNNSMRAVALGIVTHISMRVFQCRLIVSLCLSACSATG